MGHPAPGGLERVSEFETGVMSFEWNIFFRLLGDGRVDPDRGGLGGCFGQALTKPGHPTGSHKRLNAIRYGFSGAFV